MDSECHISGIESTVKRELEARGLPLPNKVDIGVGYSEGALSAYVQGSLDPDSINDDEYYALMSMKESYIGDTKQVRAYWSQEINHLPQGTTTRITFSFEAPLRADDLETLYMLGKVNTTVRKAEVEETVSCTL